MDIAILAPSPVPFAMGGAEHLWIGLQAYLNEETGHNCELVKFPSRGGDFREILVSYLEPGRFGLEHFDILLTGKNPAWFVEHADHRVYMLHKLRGLYDTYHFFREPNAEEPQSGSSRRILRELGRLAREDHGPTAARRAVERFLKEIDNGNVDQRDMRFPGPLSRQVVHLLDSIALSPSRIKRYAAISRTVAKRVDYFPGGVDVAIAYPPPRLTGFKCKRPEHFFTVSRLDSAKRIDLIIREYRKVTADVNLIIGGTGPALDDLRAAADGDHRIVFVGALTDAETLDYYARSIAVPFTPYDEDYGLVTVEAMKSCKPVITVEDSGGVTELVRHGTNGWCVPNEEGALTRAFEEALQNPRDTAELGKAAERSVRKIRWGAVAKGLLEEGKVATVRSAGASAARNRQARGKLVVATTSGIFPPRGGGQSRIFHLYSKAAEAYDITAVCLVGSGEQYADRMIADNFRELRIPKTEAHEEAEAKRSSAVDWVPITDIVCADLIGLTPEFNRILASEASEADAVIASGPYLVDSILQAVPEVPLLYEAQNFELELKRDILPDSPAGSALLETVARVERTCWAASRMVFACASRDLRSLLAEYGPSSAVQIEVPNGFSPDETYFTAPAERRELARSVDDSLSKSAVFLGSWHGPNLSAVESILGLAPLFDDVRFLLVGSACLAFQDRPMPTNVVPFGIVDEEEKSLLLASASVALNPMTEGSGSNLKMLDYFGAGIPVISTAFGARGLNAMPRDHFIQAELDSLPMVLSRFFSARESHERMVSRARSLAVENYSWDVIGSDFRRHLEELLMPRKKGKRLP